MPEPAIARDHLLDEALGAVLGVHLGGPGLVPDYLAVLDPAELRQFAGKALLLAAWALEADSAQDLANTVVDVQRASAA